jgi:prepilin-type processing-associated H-X9-DG protein
MHTGFTISNAAATDYSAIRSVENTLMNGFPTAVDPLTKTNRIGPFSYNSSSAMREMTWASVTDGLSNTLSYVEVAGRPDRYVIGRRKIAGSLQGSAWADESNEFGLDGCTPSTTTDIRPGLSPINCMNNGEPYSFHPGGINTGLCDGSVRFMSETIPIRTFAALVSAQAGEIIGDF